MAQKIRLPCLSEVQNWNGHGRLNFWATTFKFWKNSNFSRCSNDSKIIFLYSQRYKSFKKSVSAANPVIPRSTININVKCRIETRKRFIFHDFIAILTLNMAVISKSAMAPVDLDVDLGSTGLIAQSDFLKLLYRWKYQKWFYYHLNIFKRYEFSQNLKVVAQKLSPPRPFQFWTSEGRGSLILWATPFKFWSSIYLL